MCTVPFTHRGYIKPNLAIILKRWFPTFMMDFFTKIVHGPWSVALSTKGTSQKSLWTSIINFPTHVGRNEIWLYPALNERWPNTPSPVGYNPSFFHMIPTVPQTTILYMQSVFWNNFGYSNSLTIHHLSCPQQWHNQKRCLLPFAKCFWDLLSIFSLYCTWNRIRLLPQNTKWDKIFNSGPSKICERQPLNLGV